MNDVKVTDPVEGIIKIDGVPHHLVDEVDDVYTCRGCAFDVRDDECLMPRISELNGACAKLHAIWRPIHTYPSDKMFSVEEVLTSMVDLDYIPSTLITAANKIEKHALQRRDPEYAEYVRLRSKFE